MFRQIGSTIIVIFTSLSILSCQPLDNVNGLSFSTSLTTIYIMPAGNNSTCASINAAAPDNSIKAPYFSIPSMTMKWSGAGTLTVTRIKMTLNSTALTSNPMVVEFAGTDLMSAWVLQYGNLYDSTSPFVGLCLGTNATAPCLSGGLQFNSATPPFVSSTAVANTIYLSNSCPFMAGDIGFLNPKSSATGSIEIQVEGYFDSGNGEIQSVAYKNYVNFRYPGTF